MLVRLFIKNFGLIDELEVEFSKGLNVLTGSTGAGKSIIIEGLRFVLGEKLNSSYIRDSQSPCLVEAVFDFGARTIRQHPLLREHLRGTDSSLIICRQTSMEGRAKIKVNGLSVTVGQLKELGAALIDLHGPHDHQMLFSETAHLTILDQLTEFGKAKDAYQQCYHSYISLLEKKRGMEQLAKSRDREVEFLEYQIKELSELPLDESSYEEVVRDTARVNNAEKLCVHAAALLQLLEDENRSTGVNDLISQAFKPLRVLNQLDESTSRFDMNLSHLQECSCQIVADLKDYLSALSFEPSEAAEIQDKFDRYEDIKRKYGPDLAETRAYYEEIQDKYQQLVNLEHDSGRIFEQLKLKEEELRSLAGTCTLKRKQSAERLKKVIERELKDLGIPQVSFEARISQTDFHEDGRDKIIFYISPNIGEEMKPLAHIVSSGEAARVMLALKKALVDVDPVPVLIFDEIDAQIGGRLGAVIGQKLKFLSEHRQIILITHLPQIAAFADRHIKVIKQVKSGRTITHIEALGRASRIEELAHMMSGDKKGDIALRHAELLLSEAQE